MSVASLVLVLGLFAESVSFSSGRPPECASAHVNAWERAKAPTLRAYCDLVASATAKISSGKESARAALADTFEAEKLAPEKPYAWVLRGRALERLGRADEAYKAFGEAKRRDARSLEDPVVLLSYARVLARTHRAEEAEASYRALLPRASWLDSHERAFAYVEAGLVVMKKGPAQIDDAIAIFRQARAEAQDSSRALSTALLALALDRAGESAQAQAVLGDRTDVRALSEDPRVKDLFDTVAATSEIDAMIGEALAREKPQDAREAWMRFIRGDGSKGAWAAHANQKLAGGNVMTRARVNITVLAIAAILPAFVTSAHDARAENPPSIWDRTKDSDARFRYDLHVKAEAELESGAGNTMLRDFAARRALMMLQQAHVDQMPDVTLRIDLGRVYERMNMHGPAIMTLSHALALDPNNPEATLATYSLAISYARLDRSDDEIRTYERYLQLETNDEYRASTTLNMAEAEMRRGRLREAIDGYRDAIRLAEDIRTEGGVESYVLAIWGLCVALDRNGDATGALLEANRAASHDPHLAIIEPTDHVFFVPEYERYYYQGMGELAIAGSSANEREKAEHYDKAERRFHEYVSEAVPDDRWLARARAHLKLAESKTLKTKNPKIATDPKEVSF